VQLTRDADGLAKALAYLSARGTPIPGGQYLSHLFVVGAEAGQARLQDDVLIEGQKICAGCG
jgi:hypothetical protein